MIAAWLALLFLLPSVAWAADGVEAYCQFCRDNPSTCTCICSEPLDNIDAMSGTGHNPSDTSVGSGFECNGGSALTFLNSTTFGSMVTAATGSLPLGTDPPTHILQWKTQGDPADPCCFTQDPAECSAGEENTCDALPNSGGGSINDNDAITDFTDQTICSRIYFHASAEIVNRTGPSDNIKGSEIGRDNSGDDPDRPEPQSTYEFQPTTGDHNLKAVSKNSGVWTFPNLTAPKTSNNVQLLTDCRDNDSWCEIQVCHDHNWDTNDNMRMRARTRSLGTGDITQAAQTSTSSNAIAQLSETGRVMIWRFKIDQNTSGFVWVSHALIIRYPVDINQWIPAAEEIEGAAAPPADPGSSNGIGAPGGGITLSMLSRKLLPFYYAYMPGVH